MDGVKIGVGMFIVLPLVIFTVVLLLTGFITMMFIFLFGLLVAYTIYLAIGKYGSNYTKNKRKGKNKLIIEKKD